MFKALIIIHLMVREGEPNVTLKYISEQPSKLAISNFSDGMSYQFPKYHKGRSLVWFGSSGFSIAAALTYSDT